MRRIPIHIWLSLVILPLVFALADAALPALSVTPTLMELAPGKAKIARLANADGAVTLSVANGSIATAELTDNAGLKVTGVANGTTTVTVRDQASVATISVVVSNTAVPVSSAGYTLLAWNDTGMHCMDGDYSVFSILPPANTLHAQLINRNNNANKLVTDGVTLTYQAMADADGSINTVSSTKSNFWLYAKTIFGVDLPDDVGLAGNPTASTRPHPLVLDSAKKMFVAKSIPITPYDDAGNKNPYPMVKVVAKDAAGTVLAQARVVLPVSDDMSCAGCHSSTSRRDARPARGWITDPVPEREWKKNILALHDEKQLANPKFQEALAAKGYDSAGLLATSESGKPMLCASCHLSNAVADSGLTGIKPLTTAIHGHHAEVIGAGQMKLGDSTNRTACYNCHPGSSTKCLRGAMGKARDVDGKLAIQCQNCHGQMSNVAKETRVGWVDLPNCQACHHNGQREMSAVDAAGDLKVWSDRRYASNPNTPVPGVTLYRYSTGHGGLQCQSCHGATHAEYPSSHRNDNVLSLDVQWRKGTIGECTACHETVPTTATGGPHGMHTVEGNWTKGHKESYKSNVAACAYCHGADLRGSDLSRVKVAKRVGSGDKSHTYAIGDPVGCADCHKMPGQ